MATTRCPPPGPETGREGGKESETKTEAKHFQDFIFFFCGSFSDLKGPCLAAGWGEDQRR